VTGVQFPPNQCRAGRGLLDWTQADLADAAGVGLSTIKNFEGERRVTTAANLAAIRKALEDAGVEFIPARNGKGVGVRLSVVL
jgi:transcriptional regulator with XRE-family HTH domain